MISARVLVCGTLCLVLSVVGVTWQQLHAQERSATVTVQRVHGEDQEPATAKADIRHYESQSLPRSANIAANHPENVPPVMKPLGQQFRMPPLPTHDFAQRCTTCRARGHHSLQSVERWTGIPGMRVSEWRSPMSGLTLSEEQQFGVTATDNTIVGSHCVPCNNATYAQRPQLHGSYFNIPDSVW